MEVEKALLKPRETMFACTRPPCEIETPGCDLMWSVMLSAGRSPIRSEVTTEIALGESRIFSGSAPRVAVETTGFSRAATSTSCTFTVVEAPAVTCTPSIRRRVKPMRVTSTATVPAGMFAMRKLPSSPVWAAPTRVAPCITATCAEAMAAPPSACVTRPVMVPDWASAVPAAARRPTTASTVLTSRIRILKTPRSTGVDETASLGSFPGAGDLGHTVGWGRDKVPPPRGIRQYSDRPDSGALRRRRTGLAGTPGRD